MEQLRESIIQDLRKRYKKAVLTKKELSGELGIALSTLNSYMTKGYGIPKYKKIGPAKNAKVVFPIASVADFLSQTTEVDTSSYQMMIGGSKK